MGKQPYHAVCILKQLRIVTQLDVRGASRRSHLELGPPALVAGAVCAVRSVGVGNKITPA